MKIKKNVNGTFIFKSNFNCIRIKTTSMNQAE